MALAFFGQKTFDAQHFWSAFWGGQSHPPVTHGAVYWIGVNPNGDDGDFEDHPLYNGVQANTSATQMDNQREGMAQKLIAR
jgi:hypothetical protein